MRNFLLKRLEDESGISGTGIVAEGVQFPSGKCILAWTTAVNSIAIYDSIDDLIRIHGHGGKTIVMWLDQSPSLPKNCLQCLSSRAVDSNLH